ncbi:MAG: type II toxin-antitoxin system HigA family antitoxin [Bacteroidota bacterium]|jgi:HTH-type transcriptional regulator/antitoxin HigA
MTVRPVKSESDYRRALERIEILMESSSSRQRNDELELLSILVEHYESMQFRIDKPTPIEAIRFRMSQSGMRAKDLVAFIGSPSKVSEVLSGKRGLSISMIRNLSRGLRIPADVLLGGDDK